MKLTDWFLISIDDEKAISSEARSFVNIVFEQNRINEKIYGFLFRFRFLFAGK